MSIYWNFPYTRIFFTISPYRSFFLVIFLLVSVSPKSDTQNPRNPIQKSVSTGLAAVFFGTVATISVAESDHDDTTLLPSETIRISVLIKRSAMLIMMTPIPT